MKLGWVDTECGLFTEVQYDMKKFNEMLCEGKFSSEALEERTGKVGAVITGIVTHAKTLSYSVTYRAAAEEGSGD